MKSVALIITATLLAASRPAVAEDVTVTARIAPTVVSVGSDAILTVTVEGKFRRGASPELPPLDDFYVSESGTSQNFQFINGKTHSSIIHTYVLTPLKEGTFHVEPIKVRIGDRDYIAGAVTLEVTAARSSVTTPGADPTETRSTIARDLPGEKESIFVNATVDHDTVYVNQQITWTLGYYTDGRVGLLRSPNYTPPSAEGFWVEDLPPQNKYYTQVSGRRYLVNEIKRGYFPTAPGVYEIGEARVDVVVDDPSAGRSRIDEFFSRSFSRGVGRQHTLLTEKAPVVVLPLPTAGRPATFGGIVAQDMVVSLSADKQVAQVGEPINVVIEVDGVGNMKTIPPPRLELDGMKVYESGSSSDSFKKDYVVTGRRKYEFVIVPQEEGRRTIPAVEMSYFDPLQKRYLVARSHSVPLDIQPGTAEEGRKVIYAGGGDDIEVINRDIRFIHPVPSVIAMSSSSLVTSRVFVAAHVLPLLALFVSMAAERRRRRLSGDVGYARSSRALRKAQRGLDRGRKCLVSGDVEGTYAALSEATEGYLADKMNVSRAGLTTEVVVDHLESKGVDADEIASVSRLLVTCDAARFGAATMSADAARNAIEDVHGVLGGLERKLQW